MRTKTLTLLLSGAASLTAAALTSSPVNAQLVSVGSDVDECKGDNPTRMAACGGGGVESKDGVDGASALGAFAYADQGGTAIGGGATATTALGPAGNEGHAVAIGKWSYATGSHSIAIGGGKARESDGTVASGEQSIAIGHSAKGNGFASVAMGVSAEAGNSSIALGNTVRATHDNTVVMGRNISSDYANQVKIGASDQNYTFGGINNQLSKTRQGATSYFVTSDVNGNLATTTFDVETLEDLPQNVADLQDDVTDLQATTRYHDAYITSLQDRADLASERIDAAQDTANSAHATADMAVADNVRQDGELDAVRAVNARQDGELNEIRSVNTRQDDEITTAQATADMAVADNVRQDGELDAVRTVNTRQDGELNEIRAVNTRQDGEIATAQATADTAITRSDALGASTAAALGGGSAYNDATGAITAPSYTIDGQSYGNVGAALDAVDSRLSQVDTRIDVLSASTDRRFRHANGGIAAAMALGGTMIVPDSTVSLSFNLATYRGEQGFSGSLAVRAAPRVYFSGGFAGSTVKGSTGGRVGMAIGF
jgi:hypothetical protein